MDCDIYSAWQYPNCIYLSFLGYMSFYMSFTTDVILYLVVYYEIAVYFIWYLIFSPWFYTNQHATFEHYITTGNRKWHSLVLVHSYLTLDIFVLIDLYICKDVWKKNSRDYIDHGHSPVSSLHYEMNIRASKFMHYSAKR